MEEQVLTLNQPSEIKKKWQKPEIEFINKNGINAKSAPLVHESSSPPGQILSSS